MNFIQEVGVLVTNESNEHYYFRQYFDIRINLLKMALLCPNGISYFQSIFVFVSDVIPYIIVLDLCDSIKQIESELEHVIVCFTYSMHIARVVATPGGAAQH